MSVPPCCATSSKAFAASRVGMKPSAVMALVRSAAGNAAALRARGESRHRFARRQAPDEIGKTGGPQRCVGAGLRGRKRCVQRIFLVCGADAPGLEIAAIAAVVTFGEREQQIARGVEGNIAQRQRDFTANRGRCIGREARGIRQRAIDRAQARDTRRRASSGPCRRAALRRVPRPPDPGASAAIPRARG